MDYELIKDLIAEEDHSLKREEIVIEDVHIFTGVLLVDFYTKIVKNVLGTDREFIRQQNQTFYLDEYEQRLTEKLRQNKLDELGI